VGFGADAYVGGHVEIRRLTSASENAFPRAFPTRAACGMWAGVCIIFDGVLLISGVKKTKCEGSRGIASVQTVKSPTFSHSCTGTPIRSVTADERLVISPATPKSSESDEPRGQTVIDARGQQPTRFAIEAFTLLTQSRQGVGVAGSECTGLRPL